MSATRLGAAIDGGGTKTTACIAALGEDGHPVVLGEATAGPSNPAAIGAETAKRNLCESLRGAQSIAHVEGQPIGRLIGGLAGLEATQLRDELAAWARETLGAQDARFVTDVELLHFAGRRTLPAIVLISGTGSVAYGKNEKGQSARTGGRGYLMGDEGSGFWIGQRGLISATRALEGAAEPTALVDLLADDFGSREVDEWTQRVYSAADPRERIAQFSRHVVTAAEQKDKVALSILADAAHELAHLVTSVVRKLGCHSSPIDVVAAGGILNHVPAVRHLLQQELGTGPFNRRQPKDGQPKEGQPIVERLKIENWRQISSPASAAALQCVRSDLC